MDELERRVIALEQLTAREAGRNEEREKRYAAYVTAGQNAIDGQQMNLKSLQDRINGLADIIHTQSSRGSGMRELISYLVGAAGLASLLLSHLWSAK